MNLNTPNIKNLGSDPSLTIEGGCRNCENRFQSMCGVLNCDELDLLDAMMVHKTYDPQKTIIYEEDEAEFVFNISGGVARLCKLLPDGRRLVAGFLYPGDFAGLAFHQTYSYSVEAVTEVKVCRFPRLKLEGLFKEIPKLEDKLLGMMSNELKEAQDQMMLLARKSPKERLASFILNLSRRHKNSPSKGMTFDFPMSRVDISDYLGLTIETISRSLTAFSKSKLINLEGRKKVEILDYDALENLASGNLD